MTNPRYTEDDQEWMDPNLTEPKLQDELDRQLGLNRRNRQRPCAAYGLKSAPEQLQRRQTEITQIRYYKYVPYRGMSEPEKQKYLSLGPARLTSSRTAPPQPKATSTAPASFWPSASRAKSLKVYDYHLAELSMTYRSPPSLLDQPRRQLTTPTISPRLQHQNQEQAPPFATQRRPLFFQLHSNRGVPASAPSATQQELQQASTKHVAENGTQVSRSNTPFIDSALSNYPTEPRDVVSKSDSNRLLNVVSVDECHVRHRRRRRRMRRVQAKPPTGEEVADVDAEAWEQEAGEEDEEEVYDEEEEEEGDGEDNAAAESGHDRVVNNEAKEHPVTEAENSRQETTESIVIHTEQPEADAAVAAPPTVPSAPATRPTTERSGGGGRRKRRTEKEMRQIAAAKFLRRNEILREKMAIYLDWKLNQERMGLIELRLGDPATRFERFTMELVQQEALVANQYRVGGGGAGGGVGSDSQVAGMSQDESPQLEAQRESDTNFLRFSRQATIGSQRQELSLTEMYDALNA